MRTEVDSIDSRALRAHDAQQLLVNRNERIHIEVTESETLLIRHHDYTESRFPQLAEPCCNAIPEANAVRIVHKLYIVDESPVAIDEHDGRTVSARVSWRSVSLNREYSFNHF